MLCDGQAGLGVFVAVHNKSAPFIGRHLGLAAADEDGPLKAFCAVALFLKKCLVGVPPVGSNVIGAVVDFAQEKGAAIATVDDVVVANDGSAAISVIVLAKHL